MTFEQCLLLSTGFWVSRIMTRTWAKVVVECLSSCCWWGSSCRLLRPFILVLVCAFHSTLAYLAYRQSGKTDWSSVGTFPCWRSYEFADGRVPVLGEAVFHSQKRDASGRLGENMVFPARDVVWSDVSAAGVVWLMLSFIYLPLKSIFGGLGNLFHFAGGHQCVQRWNGYGRGMGLIGYTSIRLDRYSIDLTGGLHCFLRIMRRAVGWSPKDRCWCFKLRIRE